MRREGASVFALQLIPDTNDVRLRAPAFKLCRGRLRLQANMVGAGVWEEAVADLRAKIGSGTALCPCPAEWIPPVSRGAWAKVGRRAAALHLVDTGLMRKGRAGKGARIFGEKLGIHLRWADASAAAFSRAWRALQTPPRNAAYSQRSWRTRLPAVKAHSARWIFLIKGTIYRDLHGKGGGRLCLHRFHRAGKRGLPAGSSSRCALCLRTRYAPRASFLASPGNHHRQSFPEPVLPCVALAR